MRAFMPPCSSAAAPTSPDVRGGAHRAGNFGDGCEVDTTSRQHIPNSLAVVFGVSEGSCGVRHGRLDWPPIIGYAAMMGRIS